MIRDLLEQSGGIEARFIVWWLAGNLKTGAGEKTVIAALAKAIALTRYQLQEGSQELKLQAEELEKSINHSYGVLPDYNLVIENLVANFLEDKKKDIKELRVESKVGVPILPMLSKSIKGFSEIAERFKDEEFACEYKYDGMRG